MNGADGMQVVMAAVKYLIDWRTEKELDNYFQETLEDSEQIGRCLAEVAMKPIFTYRSSYNDVKLQPSVSDFVYSLFPWSDTTGIFCWWLLFSSCESTVI